MKRILALVCLMATAGYSAIQTAGSLLIDINASASAAAGNGAKLASITNSGTLGGDFVRVTAAQGAIYTNNFGGVQHALWFTDVNTVMTNTVAVPSGITGSNATYTIEAWVNNPAGVGEDIFSWTYRTNTAPTGRLIELRTGDAGNAMEHYGTNIGWFNRMPANGTWFHVAVVRDGSTGFEKLYANGTLVGTVTYASLNILPDGIFILGGTQNAGRNGFEQFLSGAVGAVRVHSGQLTSAQVVNNYLEEYSRYSADGIWTGAVATELDWDTAGNWNNNIVGGAGKNVYIGNGGIAKLTSDAGTLAYLSISSGGLNMTNAAAKITVNSVSPIFIGEGGNVTLNLAGGTFQTIGNSNPALCLGYCNDGFTATANIGGGDNPALLMTQVGEAYVGNKDNALSAGMVTARLNLLTNGSMIVSNNNVRIGYNGADGKITVDGGSLTIANSNPANRNYLFVSAANGIGELVINSGEINTPGIGEIQVGNGSATGVGVFRLNGGKVYTSHIWTGGNTYNMTLYLNGGEINNNPGQNAGDFIGQFKYAYIQTGGAKISIPAGTASTATQRFEHDPALGGTADGGLTLSGGGILTLTSSTNTFTGPITISQGTTLHFTHADAFTNGSVPSITLNNGAIGWKKAGGFTNLLAKLALGSTGSIVLYPENATESINLTGFPGVSVRFQGTFTYTGTITLDPGATALTFAPENNAVITYSPVMGSLPLIVNGVGNGMVDLTGDNNAWTNSITVNSGRLQASHTNALGNGMGAITIRSNAYLRINAAVPQTFVSRITADSQGYIILRMVAAALNIDLTNCPGVSLGTDEGTLNYAGTITPAADKVFRLGGGNTAFRSSANQGFVANLAGGTDTVIQQGLVRVANSTCTGNTILTNNGVLYLSGDAGFGAAPASPTANNIQLDTGGAIRLGSASVTLNSNRGVTVGGGGGEIHAWSGNTLTIPGNLSGAGKLSFTDGGPTVFSGANNIYSGILDIQQGITIIGNGTTFSWNKIAQITGVNNKSFGINANANLTWTTDMGNPLGSADATRKAFGFKKQGSGTLTVDCAQQYTYSTDLEGGTLKVAASGAVPSGAGFGDVNFYNNTKLDVNGYNITLNALNNSAGSVIDSAGTATQITLGANNNTWTLAAPITNSLTVIKTGTGTNTLSGPALGNVYQVNAGALALPVAAVMTGSLNLNGAGTTLLLNSTNGVANLTGTGKIEAIASSVTTLGLAANTASTFSGSVVATQGITIVKSGAAKQSMAAASYPTSMVWDVRSGELEFTTQPNRGEVIVQSGTTASLAVGGSGGLLGKYYTACTTYGNFTNLVTFKNYIAGFTPTYTFLTTYNGQTVLNFGNNGAGFPPPYNAATIFQAFWEGYIIISETGTYTFYTASDDGSVLFIDGALIVNNNYGQAVTERSGTVTLTAGVHAFALNYYNSGGGYGFYVNMAGPNMAKQFIPNSMLVQGGTVSGISGAGTYAFNTVPALEILNDVSPRLFAGSLRGAAGALFMKTGPATWTLTGDSSAFAGTLNVTGGVLDLSGTARLGGTIINNGQVALNVTADHTFDMSAGGTGTLVKNENSTVTLKLNGTTFDQQLTVNAGRVLFDNQGNNFVMSKQPVVTGSGSWGVVGAGILALSQTNTAATAGTIRIDTGTLGLGMVNPVLNGLVSQIDAQDMNMLTLNGTNVVRWNSRVGGQAYTNAGVNNTPYFDPAAFGGRGGVVFGAPGTETHLQSVANQIGKTVIMVARFTTTQPDNAGIWGMTGNDKGIRGVSAGATYSTPGDGNDYVNNGGKTFTNGAEMVTQTNLGTTPHIATFYAGNNGTWAGAISSTIGCYWYNSYPGRFYKGVIGEMIVYDRVITDVERLQIEAYLRIKWMAASSSIVNFLPAGTSLSLTNNGTLNLGGTIQTFGSVTGSGAITNGNAIVTGAIRPGGDGVIGTLSFAGFEQQAATYYADLSQNVGAPCDAVIISGTGTVSLDGLTVNVSLLASPGAIIKFKVMSTAGTFTGMPTLTGTTTYWKAVIGDSNKSLYLMYSSGTMIMLR